MHRIRQLLKFPPLRSGQTFTVDECDVHFRLPILLVAGNSVHTRIFFNYLKDFLVTSTIYIVAEKIQENTKQGDDNYE